MIAVSPTMKEVLRRLGKLRANGGHLLIVGEKGTGKSRLVQLTQRPLERWQLFDAESFEGRVEDFERMLFSDRPSRRKSSAALLDATRGGTLVIENLERLPLTVQAKMARQLKHPSPFRLVATSPDHIEELVLEGRVKVELFSLLRPGMIVLPPLRHRREDIPELFHHFLQVHRKASTVSLTSTLILNRLTEYLWPGNLKEMENLVIQLTEVLTDDSNPVAILDTLLPAAPPSETSLREIIRQVERREVVRAIARTRSLRSAARSLKISPQSLLRLIEKHDLN